MVKPPASISKTQKKSYFDHVGHLAKAQQFNAQADDAEKQALALHQQASSLRALAAFHTEQSSVFLSTTKTIYEKEIMKRFYAAVGMPNIGWATKISDIDPSGTNPLQYMCDVCDNYPLFKADGLNLSLPDLKQASTAGDVVTAIVKDYQQRNWRVIMV